MIINILIRLSSSAVLKVYEALAQIVRVGPPPPPPSGANLGFFKEVLSFFGERESAYIGVCMGAVLLVESKSEVPGGGLGGEAPRKLTHIFTGKGQDFNEMKFMYYI